MTVSPLSDDEVLLRRFDPTDSNAVVVDESNGVIGITGGALHWSEYEDDDRCCSTVREGVLVEDNLTRWAACDPRYTALASTSKGVIEAFEHQMPDGSQIHPFTATEDPVDEPSTTVNLAHAVAHTRRAEVPINRKQLGRAQSALAKRAFRVVPSGS